MDDTILRQTLITELDFEPSINSALIGVAVEDGVVTLTGHVSSYPRNCCRGGRQAHQGS